MKSSSSLSFELEQIIKARGIRGLIRFILRLKEQNEPQRV